MPNSITAISDKCKDKATVCDAVSTETSVDNKIQKQDAGKSKTVELKSAYGWLYWKQKEKKFISAGGKPESCKHSSPDSPDQ